MPSPDPLDAASLGSAIAAHRAEMASVPGRLGGRIEFHARIDSTNDRARQLAQSGEPEGTVVIADEQTAGRGRADRLWHSPPALGLYVSVILRPVAPAAEAPVFGLMAAVALHETFREFAAVPASIKWPNDLIVVGSGGRKKVAGILAEARTTTEGIRDLVIGMGVNVNQSESDFPPEIARHSSSMRILAGRPFSRTAVAVEILTRLDSWYTLWNRYGKAPLLKAYAAAAVDLVGHAVRVTGAAPHERAGPEPTGTTAGLDPDGALRVIPDDGGEILVIRYGEVLRLEEP